MAVKVEVKEDKIFGGKVVYTDNCITDKLVETVQDILKTENEVRVSFDVMGETLHLILSNQLGFALRDISEEYKAEVGRYKCVIRKVPADVKC